MNHFAGPLLPEAYVLCVMYATPVDWSITGVAVTPIVGVKSPQPMSAAFHGVPSAFDHFTPPVVGSKP